MKNGYIQDNWVIKPEYISKEDYPISLLLGIEFAIYKKASEIVIIASELKNNTHFNSDIKFSKNAKEIEEINAYIKNFNKQVAISQIGEDESLLDLKYNYNFLIT